MTKKTVWQKPGYKIFISHLSDDKSEISKLKKNLEIFGISCFVAHEDIQPNLEWQEKLKEALSTMECLIAVMTPKFYESDWTDQEIGFAVARDIPILSLGMGQVPHGFIGKIQAIPWKWENPAEKLLEYLMDKTKMIDAYIFAVENCSDFDDGNKLAKALPFIKELSEDQEHSLINIFNKEDQTKSNSVPNQIKNSFGFSGERPYYGKGLVHHLNRITGKNYNLSDEYKITIT